MEENKKKFRDILLETDNPVAADNLLQQFGVLMEGGGKNDPSSYVKEGKFYRARCLGDLGFVEFALKNQGYDKLVKIFNPKYQP